MCHLSPPTHASLVTHAVMAHHPDLLQFMADGSAKSAVLMSGKPGCFIAGADIRVSGTSFSFLKVSKDTSIASTYFFLHNLSPFIIFVFSSYLSFRYLLR